MPRRGRRLTALVVLLCASPLGCEREQSAAPPREEPVPTVTAAETAAAEEDRPSVLLLVADTLRADRLPIYGFAWGKTPTLDRLAAKAVVFERAVAASAATVPSHASLFTSRFVRQHSVGYSNGDTRLADEETLAEHFRKAGYETAGFISNVMLNTFTGLDRGFELYDDRLPKRELNRPLFFERDAPQTTRRAIRWLRQAGDAPVFLLVHYQDPHGPYTPPKAALRAIRAPKSGDEPALAVNETQSGYEGIPAYQALEGLDRPSQYESRYVGEILFMDRWLKKLLRAFEAHRPGAGHIVLFTSDHGESFGEEDHWFSHGHTSMPDLAHVPFLLRAPGLAPGRFDTPVSHVDVMPTLLELAGLPVPDDAAGIALGPYLRDGRDLPERELYCDLGTEAAVYDAEGFTRVRFPDPPAADRGDLGEARVERYRWLADGTWARSSEPAAVSGEAAAYLANVKPPRPVGDAPEPDHVERLRALGYIEPADD